MKAPTPTTLPATARMVAAAPVDSVAAAPVPEAVESPVSSAPVPLAVREPEALEPVAEAPEEVASPTTTVVLLLAETTRVRVEFPVPGTRMVLMPVPTAGMEAGTPTEVIRAGCELSGAG